MPPVAAEWLAKLLQLIEGGASWPQPTTCGKAFFLANTDEPSTDPMDYRIILILSRLYRRWASMRLRDTQDWIKKWQLPIMYAGVPGGGAELDWWHLSVVKEEAFHTEPDIVGATIDIYECVDQVPPPLGQTLLYLTGMPWSILLPYSEMMRNVKDVNVLPQRAGTHTRGYAPSDKGAHGQ